MKKLVVFFIVLGFLAIPLHAFSGDPVNVASKDFTEQVILGKIMVNLLKNNGIPVKDRQMSVAKPLSRARSMYTWNIRAQHG